MAAAAAHADFDLAKLASWKAGEPVPFMFLASTFEAVAEESKRLAIISIMVRVFAPPHMCAVMCRHLLLGLRCRQCML